MADTYMMASFSVVLLNLKSTHGFTCTYKLQIPHYTSLRSECRCTINSLKIFGKQIIKKNSKIYNSILQKLKILLLNFI